MQNLEELIEQFKSILIAESYLEEVKIQMQAKQIERAQLAVIVDLRAEKLEPPNDFNVKRLFSRTLVNETEQHEAEKQEYLLAALKYKDCCEVISILEFELKILEDKISKRNAVESSLEMAIENESIVSKNMPPAQYKRLFDANQSIKDCINYKREIYEAHLVALKIKESLATMIVYIADAKKYDNWGHFYAEIQVGKERQKVYMNEAHKLSHQIGVLMTKLKSELTDIFKFKSKTRMVSFGELQNFQNGFHESMITDWVVSNDVVAALSNIRTTTTYIQRIINILAEKKSKTEIKMQYFKDKRNTIIEAT